LKVVRLSHHSLTVLKVFYDDPRASLSGSDIMQKTDMLSGTLYPILIRFENAGLLKSKQEPGTASSLGRPRRRLYKITPEGIQVVHQALIELGVAGAALKPARGIA
jgi:DNA-binding PadR family transcriptional regulator